MPAESLSHSSNSQEFEMSDLQSYDHSILTPPTGLSALVQSTRVSHNTTIVVSSLASLGMILTAVKRCAVG